jgi:uncharacterized protein involved in tellurium resistance
MLIKKIFAVSDDSKLMVHLNSFDWNFTAFGLVVLEIGEKKFKCRYLAFGNINDEPVIQLELEDSSCKVSEIEELFKQFQEAKLLIP